MINNIKTLFLISVIIVCSSCEQKSRKTGATENTYSDTLYSTEYNEPELLFGIPVDSFRTITGRIKPNGFLSSILLDHGISMQEIDQLTRESADVFDVRKIRAGNNYTLFCDIDSMARLRYLVYEHDPVSCYVFSFNDSLNITPYSKNITKEIRYSKGTIEKSLWETMIENELHPDLVINLSDIYAWTVDFFGLQKGDSFKVIYEELYIEDESLGVSRIYGAQFTWAGKTITAIPLIQDGRESYFDEEGNSLRKAFLKAPLRFSRVTSRFSASRLHPILRIRRPHHGVDYAAPVGTPVYAIGDGRITFAGTENGAGKMVRIVHNSVYSTAYLHLSRFEQGIAKGAFVKQGDVIGYVGSTGLSTGPHLDFRIYQNGTPVDPLKIDAPPVEPVSEESKARFEKNKITVLSLLETF